MLAKQIEAQTMTGVVRVWRRFAVFRKDHRFDEQHPRAGDVEDYCYDKGDAAQIPLTVPRMRWDALQWCSRHLEAVDPLSPITRPPVKFGPAAKSANPAVEAEPEMLIRLEFAWQHLYAESDWREGALLGAIAKCLIGARYNHLRQCRFLWQGENHYAVESFKDKPRSGEDGCR